MEHLFYLFLDYFFIVFHGSLTLFNLVGWAWRKTRKLHLWTISLTLFSWFILGIFYGWGYCPCTDWHWQVKRMLGEYNLPASYIQYYLEKIFNTEIHSTYVDAFVVLAGLIAFGLSCWLNWKDRKGRE